MKILIEPSPYLVPIQGTLCRYWHGLTEHNIGCQVFVHLLSADRRCDCRAFDRELEEIPAAQAIGLPDLYRLLEVEEGQAAAAAAGPAEQLDEALRRTEAARVVLESLWLSEVPRRTARLSEAVWLVEQLADRLRKEAAICRGSAAPARPPEEGGGG